MKKKDFYNLIDRYLETDNKGENDEIILSLQNINTFINNIERILKEELTDNVTPKDFLLPFLNDLVLKFPEIQLSLKYYIYDNEYTIFVRPEYIFNNIEFNKISDEIINKFDEKYEAYIYFSALDSDDYYYFDGIVITGESYKQN